ncbi:Fic/DOC family protein [Testudinibacter sp. P27/CKL/0425]
MKYTGSDPFTDENGVLVNKLGIKTQAELELKERDITHLKAMKLEHSPIKGKFDLAHLQAIHKHLFGDIYAWAGQIRDGYLQKDGQDFTLGYRIVPESQKLFEKLKKENYLRSGLDNERVSNRLAYYLGEINVIHPFRDGNGRTQRIFIS